MCFVVQQCSSVGVVGGVKLLFCYINFAKCDQKCGFFFLIGNCDPWAACYTIRHLAANSMQDLFHDRHIPQGTVIYAENQIN